MPSDPVRLDLYRQLLEAADACQVEAIRIESNPVEVPAGLSDDESPPLPPNAIRTIDHVEGLVRRIGVAASTAVVQAASQLSLESTQTIAYATDRPGRTARRQLRESLEALTGAPQVPPEAELADAVSQRFAEAREAFVRAARTDLGASANELH